MQNRSRNEQLIVRVTPDEKMFIQKKMQLLGTNNFNLYARKMLMDGYVIQVDLSKYHELANEVNKVGVNINQIAKNSNTRGTIYFDEMCQLKELMNELWQLLKSSLSELQSASQ